MYQLSLIPDYQTMFKYMPSIKGRSLYAYLVTICPECIKRYNMSSFTHRREESGEEDPEMCEVKGCPRHTRTFYDLTVEDYVSIKSHSYVI